MRCVTIKRAATELLAFSSSLNEKVDPVLSDYDKARLVSLQQLFKEAGQPFDQLAQLTVSITSPTTKDVREVTRLFLRQCSDEMLMSLLDLDSWQTEGNKAEACRRIINCFRHSFISLDLSNLRLTSLPHSIGQLLTIKHLLCHNNRLTSLPDSIGRLVELEQLSCGKNQLTSLPDSIGLLPKLKKLYCFNNLLRNLMNSIDRLQSLEQLLCHANQLVELPEWIGRLSHLQKLDCRYNFNLRVLPDTIFNLPNNCAVDLSSTGLSENVLNHILATRSEQGYAGPGFSLSIPAARSSEDRSLKELLSQTYSKLKRPIPDGIEKLYHDHDQNENLRSWLARLSWTADGQNAEELKTLFYDNIAAILQLAIDDSNYRAIFQTVLMQASETCGDRVTLSIVHLDLARQLATLDRSNLSALADFLKRGELTVHLLTEIAQQKIQTMRLVDEIEVYLAYLIHLKNDLKIPFSIQGMHFFTLSKLTVEDLNRAKELVLAQLSNEDTVANYLASNPVWLEALGAKYPDEMAVIEKGAELLGEDPKPPRIALTKKALRDSGRKRGRDDEADAPQ